MAQPALGHAIAVGLFAGLVALAGVLVGGILSQRLRQLAGRAGAISPGFQPVLAVAVLTACVSALGCSLLRSLPLTGLALIAGYVAVSLVIYEPKRWPLLDGLMAGLFCGFVLSLGAITLGLIDPGLA